MFSSRTTIPLILKNNQSTKIITFLNPVSFYGFLESSNKDQFDYIFSDGFLLTRLHNIFLPSMKIERVSFDFSSIANDVFSHAKNTKACVLIIGGTECEVQKANDKLLSLYPNLNIHCRNGYFNSAQERKKFILELNRINPNIIISGMGFPHQENFLIECKQSVSSPFIGFTCGGFISQTALKTDYYHPMIKKLGLRWLQRAYLHKHVRNRLLRDYPTFLFKYLKDIYTKGENIYR
ncbi:WecB/TagA/CpsF family glycosyltransferase [Providencia rettgeri]|uniref:WecB/TagA/CpsF family glycosyltransferase n=1 Tax=Providencia TaxID=586 RepID=UPI0018E498B3|nr:MULTISPECIES: WecB/TagA/CpsF family glycosyltransferase [Providencia]EJD6477294.1 WecB/TagA/CpsF family glycosyltransferase [Providencia rettgeri]ELR5065661.1 WecB/TagA/CpsF family glycosyltransferase [Providencia rettgeri]MBI6194331.1 WecB/TagA/CpsF family glycosyltransferase [Providencia rettgeri]UPQ39340.1 WecB/TagA/CpsF family glycosyltransferase [Providencia rettgeri]